jgi:hypothetical protein
MSAKVGCFAGQLFGGQNAGRREPPEQFEAPLSLNLASKEET